MLISDWSSYVCSSDLLDEGGQAIDTAGSFVGVPAMSSASFVLTLSCADRPGIVAAITTELAALGANIAESNQFWDQIGRASRRERVCQYVEIAGVAGSQRKNKRKYRERAQTTN